MKGLFELRRYAEHLDIALGILRRGMSETDGQALQLFAQEKAGNGVDAGQQAFGGKARLRPHGERLDGA